MPPPLPRIAMTPRSRSKRIGVLLGGLGAISTTLIAGVEAIKKGLAQPVGSLALLGTLNVGSDEEPRHLRIRDYLDLPGPQDLDNLAFGAWDVVPTDGYAAPRLAGALEVYLIDSLAHELASIRAWPGIFDPRFNRRSDISFYKQGRNFLDLAEQVQQDILRFQAERALERSVFLWCGSTEAYLDEAPAHQTLARFEAAMLESDHTVIAPSMIYAYAEIALGIPFVNATPSRTVDIPALMELAARYEVPIAGKDLKTGQTLIKTILAPGLRDRMLGLHGWYSTNILGNGDGATLEDPEAFRTKQESKLSVLNSIKIDFLCRDSILAAPLLLDLALFMDLAKQAHASGPQEWLSFYFKSPLCADRHAPEPELSRQLAKLRQALPGLARARAAAV